MRISARVAFASVLSLCSASVAPAQTTATVTGRVTGSLTAASLADARVRIELLDPFTSITGTIVDASTGLPITSTLPTVHIYNSTGPQQFESSATPDGVYTFWNLPLGVYYLRASAAGYVPELFPDIPCAAADCSLTSGVAVPVGLNTAVANFSLAPGGSIGGTVRRASDASPASGLTVEVYNAATSFVGSAVLAADGTYVLRGLPPGSYYVRTIGVWTPGVATVVPRVYGGEECPPVSTNGGCRIGSGALVPVTPGAQAAVDFSLRSAGSVTGTVTLESGGPAAGVRVEAYAGGVLQSGGSTTASGSYVIPGLAPGAYQVRTNTIAYNDEWYGGQYVAAGPPNGAVVAVESGGTTSGVDFVLATGGAITGTLTHDLQFLGYGGSGLQIVAYNSAGQFVRAYTFFAPLSAAGTIPYTIDNLPTGTYYLRAMNAGSPGASPWFFRGGDLIEQIYGSGSCVTIDCDPRRGAPVHVTSGQVTSGIDFNLVTGGSISGLPLNAEVYDARGALVDPRRLNRSWIFLPTPPSYVGLPAGTYFVRVPDGRLHRNLVCPECAATEGTPIVVWAGQASPASFADPPARRISGTVRQAGALTPISTVVVTAHTQSGEEVSGATSDQFGAYTILGLAPGTYYLRARDDHGFVDELYADIECVDCAIGNGTPVVVPSGADVTGIDFTLAPGGTITGRVSDVSDVSLDAVQVSLFDASGGLRARTKSDTRGLFTAEVPAGTYYARSDPADGYAVQVYRDLSCADAGGCAVTSGTPLTVTLGAPLTGVDFHLHECTGVTLSPSILATGAAGDAYRQRFTASGGVPPHQFVLVNGTLPPGMTLNAADGVLAGTPTASGTYDLTVAAVDATGCPAVRQYSLQLASCSFLLSPSSLTAPASGGSFPVVLADGCGDRSVTSPASWVRRDAAASTATHIVLVVDQNAAASPRSATLTIGRRTFLVQQAGTGSEPPFGSFDAPLDGMVVSGSTALGGWALDDLEVLRVAIYRDPVAGEAGLVFLGNAVFVPGARPDVAAAYPGLPGKDRAGWGFLVLTNMLPNQGNGFFRLHAIAEDLEGHQTVLGTRSVNAVNAGATLPFGAIDTPAQGATIGGSAYVNFGWALTPQPKMIPIDGSTITVLVDGAPAGHPAYNFYRVDVSTLFPGLANSAGPIGYLTIDTTALQEGLHTISWVVADNASAVAGIGSRYFTVSNSTDAPATALAAGVSAQSAARPIGAVEGPDLGRRAASFELDPASAVTPDTAVTRVVGIDIAEPSEVSREVQITSEERVELALESSSDASCPATWAGYQDTQGELRELPVGASLDRSGRFFWQPGPAFSGRFALLFVRTACDGTKQQLPVTITVTPRSW
jgi:Putative Ig domain/Carboxypeptidase regulatory-like domain